MRAIPIFAIALAGTIAAGCTTVNPYTREEQTSKLARGAAIGAAAGAVLGALSGDDSRDRRKRALIGAGVGTLAGGSVGYYMDVQEAKLRRQMEGTGVSVTRRGDEIILNMPSNVTFDVDSTAIAGRFANILDGVSLVLEEYDSTLVEVVGHTDSTGAADYNQQLSERRAASVGSYLIRAGVIRPRVATAGYGESYPVASNATAEGRQANRRVELTLVPVTS